MTKFKKCDYCKIESRTTEKYRTSFLELGSKPGGYGEVQGMQLTRGLTDLFYLCKGCREFLIPKDKLIAKNKVDNDFYEQELKDILGKKHRYAGRSFSPRKGQIQ